MNGAILERLPYLLQVNVTGVAGCQSLHILQQFRVT